MTHARPVIAVGLVVLASTLLLATGPVSAQEEVTLTVLVVDRAGEPVSDLDLSATWDGGPTVNETTRANGQALIDVPAGADVDITIHDDTYIRNRPYVVEDATSRDVRIPVAARGTTTLTIQSPAGPVSGATVQLEDNVGSVTSEETNAEGVATLGPVERGRYTVDVRKPGYLRNRTDLVVRAATEETITIQRGTVELSVAVVDDHFDPAEPVENATVQIGPLGSSLPTLSSGRATTAVPVNREYELTVEKDGYETTTAELTVAETAVATNVSIRREPAVNIRTANQRVVVGETTAVTVTDEYGDPIEGAEIRIDGEAVGTTDADGTLTVQIESAGSTTVTAHDAGLDASVTVDGVDPDATGTATATATEGENGPGFGPVVAALAVGLIGGLLRRRS